MKILPIVSIVFSALIVLAQPAHALSREEANALTLEQAIAYAAGLRKSVTCEVYTQWPSPMRETVEEFHAEVGADRRLVTTLADGTKIYAVYGLDAELLELTTLRISADLPSASFTPEARDSLSLKIWNAENKLDHFLAIDCYATPVEEAVSGPAEAQEQQ